MKLSRKEIENVTRLDAFERYKHFIKRVADFEKMYSLKKEKDDWAIAAIENIKLFSLWPAKEYAELCISDEWRGYHVAEIRLDFFENELAATIECNIWLINVFSVHNQTGFVVSIEALKRDLDDELQKYE